MSLSLWLILIMIVAVVLTLSEAVRRQTRSLTAGLVMLASGGFAGYALFVTILLMTSY